MSFTSPMQGRFTSAFGRRGSSFHAGIDIAPPKAGTVGTAVYAASAGKIVRIVRGRKYGQSSSVGAVLAPGRSGNGVLIAVGSGRHLYGHVNILSSLKYGDTVKTGQLLGYTDRSGIQTGPHLHFETWRTSSASSYYNPVTLFTKAGIKVGSAPKKSSAASPSNRGYTVARTKQIQTYLKNLKMYTGKIDGDYGNMTFNAVKTYQKKAGLYVDGLWGPKTQAHYDKKYGKKSSPSTSTSGWARPKAEATALVKKLGYSSISRYQAAQKCTIGLKPDGVWGKITEKHYQETRQLQTKMNGWKGNNLRVDGDYGNKTVARVRDIKQRNKGGTFKGTVNSIPDATFMKMIGLPVHDHK